MKHLKSATLIFCLFSFQINLLSQEKLNIKFGKISKEDFSVSSPLIDSNTNAVVVADIGNTEFLANTNDLSFSLIFKEKKRIKIINKNGFDAATITIPLYVSSEGRARAEKLDDLKAYTYNLENGTVTETKLNADQVFTEKMNKNWVLKKFTFPAVKEGCIIEYTYRITSDFFFNLQSWEFQSKYPVLWSQYETGIPEFFKYIILSQGYQPYAVNKTESSLINYKFTQKVEQEGGFTTQPGSINQSFTVDGRIDYHTWVMKNVPALKDEPFSTTTRNYIAKIEFQLQQIAYRGSVPVNYTNTWEKLSTELLENYDFGMPFSRPNNWLDADLDNIIAKAATEKEKAKKIYEYVRDNFTCIESNNFYISKSLKEIYNDKSGSVAEINLLLIAMLRNKNINANPILLSTRSHGIINPLYPLITKFNYVVVQAELDGHVFYLDASKQRLPFGKLPLQVYNGHSRIINKEAKPVFFETDSLNEVTNTSVIILNTEGSGVEGAYNFTAGTYGSFDVRDKIAKSTLEEYKKGIKDSYPEDVLVSNIEIDSLKIVDEPVSIKYDIKLSAFGNADIVYFNPILGDMLKKNPFSAAVRFYPVEMPYKSDITYVLSMEIPKGYKVDELPESVRIKLNENEGMFEYIIENNGESIQMRCKLQVKATKYLNEDYQTLRDFYSFVVKKEAEQIVFKKIK